jgi:hypothetical protein
MADNADAIILGVNKWLDANKKDVLEIIEAAVAGSISVSTEKAINMLVAGVMVKIAAFLNTDRDELNTAIAAAIAANWQARQHPIAPMPGGGNQ